MWNNLAKKGPDHDDLSEGIIFKAQERGQGAGARFGQFVDVEVHALGGYKPFSVRKNGLHGKYGVVTIAPNSHLNLELVVKDHVTKKPIIADDFALTFFDLDTGNDNHSVEYVDISSSPLVRLSFVL